MKRVLFLDHASVVGGAQLVLLSYLKYIKKSDFKLVVACSDKNLYLIEEFKKHASSVYIIKFEKLKALSLISLVNFWQSVLSVLKVVREEKIDVLAANTERAVYVGTIVSIVSGVKIIWFIRDFMFSKILFWLLHHFASKIIFVSKSVQGFYGRFGKKAKVIYVSSDMYRRVEHVSARDIDLFKREFNLKGKIVVGFIGRLVEWKGAHILIKALSFITSITNKEVVGLIVGNFDTKENLYKDKLLKLANTSGCSIVFTGFRKDIDVVLRSLDVFVHPSLEREPYATSIVEALMAKVPVIATNLGGTPEIIRHRKTGLLIEPNDPYALAKELLFLLRSKNVLKEIKEKGYLRVVEHNKIENEVRAIEKLLTNL